MRTWLPLILVAACSGASDPFGSNGSNSTAVDVRVGSDEMPVAVPGVRAVYVTIARIEAKSEHSGFTTVATSPPLPRTIDLFSLQHANFTSLGLTSMPTGEHVQLRVIIDPAAANYVLMNDGTVHPLTVPSGDESGIKVIGDFKVPSCATGVLTVLFVESIDVHAGDTASDAWMLRPVIRFDAQLTGHC